MRHISIKLNSPCEFIDITPVNPLISKCQIKVCQVGDTPNRNGSIITEDVARKLANSIPGSPIVGHYIDEKQDFNEHDRELVIKDGELDFGDMTQPYGFVDLNAKVWFQDFSDDGHIHKYLMTEGYIWTGRYPETQRIIEKGNNQSMELDQNSLKGNWSKNENGDYEFFIINEAILSALCILGEDNEPCFEGASINKVQFSLEDSFKEQIFSMMNEMKEILSKGGEIVEDNKIVEAEVTENVAIEESVVEEPVTEFAEETVKETVVEEAATEEETVVEEPEVTVEEPVSEPDPEPAAYVLDEIPEYVELVQKFATLEAEHNALLTEVEGLREFKLSIERTEKQALIDKFYMLSDEDKQDVVSNIDSYSLNEIEAKLCVTCFHKGINFIEAKEEKEATEVTTYNLNQNDTTPAWIKAIEARGRN